MKGLGYGLVGELKDLGVLICILYRHKDVWRYLGKYGDIHRSLGTHEKNDN